MSQPDPGERGAVLPRRGGASGPADPPVTADQARLVARLLDGLDQVPDAAWRVAVDAAGIGAFDWDLVDGRLRWDDRLLELFGLDHRTFAGTIEAFSACVHPEDRDRVSAALARAVDECGEYEAEYRVVLPTGEERWITARGRALPGPDGSAVRLLGAAHDSTSVRGEESRVARVLESMPTAFYQLDRQWRFSYLNAEAERLLGRRREELVGGSVWELFPATVGTAFEEHYRRAVRSGEPVAFEAYYPAPLDGWYEIRGWPSPDGLAVYFVDVSARRRAQSDVDRATARAGLVASVTEALTDTLDITEAVRRLPRLVTPVMADWCIITLLREPAPSSARTRRGVTVEGAPEVDVDPGWRENLRDAGYWHHDPALRRAVDDYATTRLTALADSAPLARAVAEQRPVLHRTDATEALLAALAPGPAYDAIQVLRPRSGAFVPLRARGHVVGLLSAFRGPERGAFGEDDVTVLTDIGNRAGIAIDNARMFGRQRELAETLQRSMLTEPPQPDDLQVAVRYAPAAHSAQVGGDWYDAFVQDDGAMVVVIGDVVGHDVDAAAAMGQLRSLLRGIAAHTGDGPAVVLAGVDRVVEALAVDTMATALVARFEEIPEDRRAGVTRLRWSNAGHLDPVVVAPDGTVSVLAPSERHTLIGVVPDQERTDDVVDLPRGSTVLFYTDGLVERRGEALDRGIDRLVRELTGLVADGLPLDEVCDGLLERLVPEGAEDDVALLAVHLGPRTDPATGPSGA